jgi:hypothetical protein
MRANTSKSKISAEQIEYLEHWITRQGIKPMKKRKELHQLIGIFNYYRDLWFRRYEILSRFNSLASHQARSSLIGTHPINRPIIKLRSNMNWYAYVPYIICNVYEV